MRNWIEKKRRESTHIVSITEHAQVTLPGPTHILSIATRHYMTNSKKTKGKTMQQTLSNLQPSSP